MHVLAIMQAVQDAATSGSSSLVTVYYVAGILVALGGVLEAGRRYFNKQRLKWTEEGEGRAKQSQAIEENNTRLQQNTAAIADLTAKLADFILTTRAEMNGLGHRMTLLERRRRDRDHEYDSDIE